MSHTMDRNALVTSGCDTRGLSSVERELDRVSPVQKGGIERDPLPIERERGRGSIHPRVVQSERSWTNHR